MQVVTPVKKGDIYLYSQPNRSMEDYDVPPSRYVPSSKEPSPEPAASELYDTPTNLPVLANSSSTNNFYDTIQPSIFERCQPWRAKRRLVDPSSREAALLTRRAHSARGQVCLRPRERFWGLGCPKIYHEVEDTLAIISSRHRACAAS